jgi:hypothetical protein
MATVFVTSRVGGAASRVSRHATSPAGVAVARALYGDDARLIGYQHFEPTLAFYAQSEVEMACTAADLEAMLARTPSAVLVTRDDVLGELTEALGEPPQIVARHSRVFRGKGEIVVVRPPARMTAARIDDSLNR